MGTFVSNLYADSSKRFVEVYRQIEPNVYIIKDTKTNQEFVVIKVKGLDERLASVYIAEVKSDES